MLSDSYVSQWIRMNQYKFYTSLKNHINDLNPKLISAGASLQNPSSVQLNITIQNMDLNYNIHIQQNRNTSVIQQSLSSGAAVVWMSRGEIIVEPKLSYRITATGVSLLCHLLCSDGPAL